MFKPFHNYNVKDISRIKNNDIMEAGNNNMLNGLKGKSNPFKVPEGYMENLTANIMNAIPKEEDDARVECVKISLFDRIKPWLYMAAVFAGLGLFFKAIMGEKHETKPTQDFLVKTEIKAPTLESIQAENDEYLEYLEDKYSNYLMDSEVYGMDSLDDK